MKQIQPQKRSIGVNFNASGEAEILVWAPLAEKVSLVITNNQERLQLEKKDYGYWKLTTSALQLRDTYKFLLNDETERPDPASVSQPEGVHGVSRAIDLNNFEWTDNTWVNPRMQDYIFYELHTGTFTPEGTFEAIEKKLDHLIELGITAIEIMPVAQFPGDRNWGYDGVFPFATQNSYGGAEGLMHLVDTCHAKGLAVVLDVVYNHMGPEGNYFNDFGPYFTDKYNTPWGNAINFDDAWCDAVRHYFIENVLMWFRDFHIDALRLDAVHAIKDFSPAHILREIKQHTDALKALTGKKYHLVAETDLNDPRFINPLDKQGYGLDAQWIDEFHHALRVTAGEERSGYYSDFEGINHLAKAYTDAYIYDGIYSPHRFKTFGTKTDNEGKQFVVFSQNHDQVGNRMLGERTSTLVSFEMQKLMAAAVLAAPYLPMLFMGEEWSEPHPFLYFTSHTDKDLAEAVRKGRKEEFKAFHAQSEAPDPQAEETFNESKLQWDLITQGKHAVMLKYYQMLINLRKQYKPLSTLNRKNLTADFDSETQTLVLRRWHESEHVCCLMNFSKTEQTISLPSDADWRLILNSSDEQWGGSSSFTRIAEKTAALNPESILIFANNHV